MLNTITNLDSTFTAVTDKKEYKTPTKDTQCFAHSNIYDDFSSGKNAKLPGYMDYLHLSTADVAILKGSWSVLEEHVTRVSIIFKSEEHMRMSPGGESDLRIIREKLWLFQVGVDFFIDMMTNHEEIKAVFRQVDDHDHDGQDNDDKSIWTPF